MLSWLGDGREEPSGEREERAAGDAVSAAKAVAEPTAAGEEKRADVS